MSKFKKLHNFEKRVSESTKVLTKYPDRIPIIVECIDDKLPKIDKNKFLVPKDLNIGQFQYVVRKRINLNQELALFFFINEILPSTHQILSSVYEEYKDKDGFLYISYSGENTFG